MSFVRTKELDVMMAILVPTSDTLSDFFFYAKTANVVIPSEDLIIGTHADDEGIILVTIDSTTPGPITYEKLQNATSHADGR